MTTQETPEQHPVYEIFSGNSASDGSDECIVYGIRAVDPVTRKTLMEVNDISDDEKLVSSLKTLFNENRLQLVNFQQTVELLVGVLV